MKKNDNSFPCQYSERHKSLFFCYEKTVFHIKYFIVILMFYFHFLKKKIFLGEIRIEI